mmetsp:Transcript_6079/g.12054  ORF Transcript_6079/g.12054 Transcript_6079/m.12054 type:complete len:1931 (+) Transcript_6079:131-5923(+)
MPTAEELQKIIQQRKKRSSKNTGGGGGVKPKKSPPRFKPPAKKPTYSKVAPAPSKISNVKPAGAPAGDSKGKFKFKLRKTGGVGGDRKKRRDSITEKASMKTDQKGRIDILQQLTKRTKNRKKAKYISRNKGVIKQLLRDMTARSKFGKMLSYSLTCLTNLCVDEVSCEELLDSEVLDVLEKVLKKNPYNEHLQKLVNNFLKKVAINEDMARLVAARFSGKPLVDSLQNHLAAETIVSTCETSVHVMDEKFAGKLDKGGVISAVANVLHRNNNEQLEAKKKEPEVAAAAAKLCASLVTSKPQLAEKMIESGVTDDLMRAIKIHPQNKDLALATMSTIQKIAEHDPALAARLKDKGVVGVLVGYLEQHPEDEIILKAGADALKCLGTTSELAVALGKLKSMDGGAMATIGALSLVGKNVDYLIKNGGIELITGLLRDLSENPSFDVLKDENARRFVVNGCYALERMATDDQNIFQLMNQGGVQVLLDVVRKCYKSPEVAAAAYAALSAFCSRPENAAYLVKLGTIESVKAIMKIHKNDVHVAKKTIGLYDSLCQTPDIATEILRNGDMKLTLAVAKMHYKDKHVAMNTLSMMDKLITQLGAPALSHIAACGGAEVAVLMLKEHGKDDPVIAKMALETMLKLCKDPHGLKQLRDSGALQEVLTMLKTHKNDRAIVALASKVAGNLVSEDDVKRYMSELETLVKRVKNGDESAISELLELTNLLNGIANVPSNRKLMEKCGLLQELDRALDVVQSLKESEEKAEILRNIASIVSLMAQDREGAEVILKKGLHKRILELALKRKDEDIAASTCELFKHLALDAKSIRTMESDGSLELVKQLGEMFEDDQRVTGAIADLYKEVSKIKGGNVKEAVTLSLSALSNHEDADKINGELEYLISLSNQKGALKTMVALGGLQAVVDILREHNQNPDVQKSSLALLNKMADEDDDILLAFCEMGGVEISCKAMRKLFNVEGAVENEMVFLSRCSENKECLEYFLKAGMANARLLAWATKAYPENEATTKAGISILTKLRDAQNEIYLLKKKEEEELLLEAQAKREAKIKAGGKRTLEELQFILQGLDVNSTNYEDFEGLLAIVGNPENSSLFVEAGGLDFMMDVLLNGNNMDDETYKAAVICFDTALGNMDKELINLMGDSKAMDMMMQVLNPKRAGGLNWDNLGNTMRAVVTMTEDSVVLNGMLERGDLKGALMMISSEGTDEACLIPAMKTLARVSNDKDEMKAFANPENLRMLLEAMRRHMDKPDFILYACYLLGNLACNTHIQDLIGELQGVQVLAKVMDTYPDRADVIEKACYALRALSLKNNVNCGLMMRYDIHTKTLSAMGDHTGADTRFWINTVRLMLNLCKQNKSYAEEIQRNEGDMRIIEVIYSNTDDDAVVKFCCRVLERLATRSTYMAILENSVIHALNPALSRGEEHAESVVAVMKVIDRLAQFSRSNRDAMGIFIAENAHRAVARCVSAHRDNANIMTPAVECLAQLAHDETCSITIVKMRVVEVLRDALVEIAYDERFCKSAMSLIDRLSYNTANISSIVDAKIVPVMADVAETYIESKPLVSKFLSSCLRICSYKSYALKLAGSVIPQIVKITAHYLDNDTMLLACFGAMGSLTFLPQTAKLISSKSCEMSMKAMKSHYNHTGLQRSVLEYLSGLFLQPKAAEVGILETKILADVVGKLKTSEDTLLDNTLTVLYHASTATNKVKDQMKAQSVIQDLKETKVRFSSIKHVVDQCDKIIEAILTPKVDVNDLQFDSAEPAFIDSAFVWKEEKKKVEAGYTISMKLKNFLTAGMEIKWHAGGKKGVMDTHLHVSKNLKQIIWTKGLGGVGGKAKSMGTWRMRRVKSGVKFSDDWGKKAYKTKVPMEERCFVLMGEDAVLAFECPTEVTRNKWIKALEALKLHHKEHKKLATDWVNDGVYKGYTARV